MISYDKVTIVSRQISKIKSRALCNTDVEFCGLKLSLPLIASPMHDVCGGVMARELASFGTLGIINRFQSIDEQTTEFQFALSITNSSPDEEIYGGVACAIGLADYKQRYSALFNAGCRIFCIDTANGANTQIEDVVKFLQQSPEKNYIITGNVATKEGYLFLAKLGVDAVRVGIAGGSVCETRTETGIYIPTLESVNRCASARVGDWPVNKDETNKSSFLKKMPLIIADGGIRTPSDMNKALIAGADVVMCGSIFAGTKESPGEVFNEDGVLYKLYRGSASFGVQKIAAGEEPDYIEGREIKVKYKGSVEKVIKRFKNGLQSCMSYSDAKTIDELRQQAILEIL
jgi:IMP dehydrogenase